MILKAYLIVSGLIAVIFFSLLEWDRKNSGIPHELNLALAVVVGLLWPLGMLTILGLPLPMPGTSDRVRSGAGE